MIIKELIEKLKQMPQDAEVWFCTPDNQDREIDNMGFSVVQDRVYLE